MDVTRKEKLNNRYVHNVKLLVNFLRVQTEHTEMLQCYNTNKIF